MNELPIEQTLYTSDDNDREIKLFKLTDVSPAGLYYPYIQFQKRYSPVRERVMSLPGITYHRTIESRPMFFFVYNVDNYYHFVYDTLPYLITYRHLKKTISDLKLLINFSDRQHHELNRFVMEFLELLDIFKDDLVFIDHNTIYETVYVSSSYTHEHNSNLPPRKEIYDLYKELVDKVEEQPDLPKKIYVSRRSHRHGQYDNIGTNYTARRKLANEDALVDLLERNGYTEVFTELLTTKQKIAMFKGCTHIVGAIGGGICNVLFSKPTTKLIAIVSPHFLDINARFHYSLSNVDVKYFHETKHTESSKFKKYMRVLVEAPAIVGEIKEVDGESLLILWSQDAIAGWNSNTEYRSLRVRTDEVKIIDPGLNSEWTMDLKKFEEELING